MNRIKAIHAFLIAVIALLGSLLVVIKLLQETGMLDRKVQANSQQLKQVKDSLGQPWSPVATMRKQNQRDKSFTATRHGVYFRQVESGIEFFGRLKLEQADVHVPNNDIEYAIFQFDVKSSQGLAYPDQVEPYFQCQIYRAVTGVTVFDDVLIQTSVPNVGDHVGKTKFTVQIRVAPRKGSNFSEMIAKDSDFTFLGKIPTAIRD